MRYVFAAIAMSLCLTIMAVGQVGKSSNVETPCTMTADQLPEIRGLRLGMTVADVSAAFPEDSSKNAVQKAVNDAKKPDAYGFGAATLFSGPESNPKFDGLQSISLQLVDERVSMFRVDYARGTTWKSADQFVNKLSDAFHLPAAERWKRVNLFGNPYETESANVDYGVRLLTCNGFTVLATINNGNGSSAILVKNPTAEQVVDDRREATKEKARQAFKP
jgi:hypothetical protein